MTAPSLDVALDEARALLRARQPEAARERYRAILAQHPYSADAHFMLGLASAELRDFSAAVASVEKAFALVPQQAAPSRLAFAHMLVDAGDAARAEREARETLRLKPDWAPALNVLGLALQRQQREDDALAAFNAAVVADPRHFAAQRNRARALHRRAQVYEAMAAYRAALALDDRDPDLWNELAIALTDACLLAEARDASQEALRRAPGYHQVESNVLIAMHYDPSITPAAMFEAHRAWNARHAIPLAAAVPVKTGTHKRLRVGFLSPQLRSSPTGYFVLPLFEHLDRTRFEVFAYNARGVRDELTTRLQRSSDAWHDAWTEDDAALAEKIRADRIDILVDLAGHSPGGRLLVLARKPAPVIVTWLDYFDTTGLDAVDFLIGDPVSMPVGGAQRFSEKVIRIAPCRLCYSPPEYAPPVAAAPVLRNGFITFGSFNRRSKITPEVVALWSSILRDVPDSKLLLKNAALADATMREVMLKAFEANGVARARIELRGHSPHAQMLAEYGDMDIALDTFPYNGGLTTSEALWMGVPVLAIAGDSMISRQSAALLSAAGLQDWIVADGSGLVAIARDLASDIPRLAALRSGLRENLAASPLTDARAFASRFGDALLQAWDRLP